MTERLAEIGGAAAGRRSRRSARADVLAVAALTALWVATVLLINPRGDFPLNDDWAYGLPALHLADTGALRFTNFQSMPLITHTLWGALHAALLDSSFTTLRLSTIVAAWAGLLLFYILMRQCTGPLLALLAALLLAANPLYVALAHTFMTDVLFVALMLAAGLAFWYALRYESTTPLVIATILSVAATLTRQVGLALPIAWACACLMGASGRQRRAGRAFAPILITCGALAAYTLMLHATLGLPQMYADKGRGVWNALAGLVRGEDFGLLRGGAWALAATTAYLGLLTLPLTLVAAPAARWIRARELFSARWLLVILFAALVLVSLSWELPLPLAGNLLVNFGIGPRTLIGTAPTAPAWVLFAVSFVAWAGAAWLVLQVAALARCWPTMTTIGRHRLVFVAALGVLLVGPAFAAQPFYDRYLLPLIPLALLALVTVREGLPPAPRWAWGVAATLTSLLLAFSVAGTHDYLAWNRARWQAVAWLQSRGVEIDDMDGGFEVNNVELNRRALAEGAGLPPGPVYSKTATYELWFDPPPERDVVARWNCRPWLPWAIERIGVVRE